MRCAALRFSPLKTSCYFFLYGSMVLSKIGKQNKFFIIERIIFYWLVTKHRDVVLRFFFFSLKKEEKEEGGALRQKLTWRFLGHCEKSRCVWTHQQRRTTGAHKWEAAIRNRLGRRGKKPKKCGQSQQSSGRRNGAPMCTVTPFSSSDYYYCATHSPTILPSHLISSPSAVHSSIESCK